jgi:hypothetical protein
MLIVDLFESLSPRRKKVGQLQVKAVDLDRVLAEWPHLAHAQLALF